MHDDLTVLFVEDDPHVLLGCQQALLLEDIPVVGCASAEQALQKIEAGMVPGIVISDIRLPGMDGLTLMDRLLQLDRQLPVVLITGHGDVAMAVQAMKDGAYDFVEKPFSPEKLVDVARRAMAQRRLTLEVASLRRQLDGRQSLEQRIIGRSDGIRRLRELLLNVADTAANVLIHGETGTGKELVASCLHDFSRRKDHQYVAINCGGLPENLFESEIFGHEANAFTGAGKRRIGKIEHAHKGTLFLDEVESMPINLQIKLLRVLQEHKLERLGSNQAIPVDCRLIAATKDDLDELSQQGKFRSDFYYRLNVVTLELPPLRERREDIPLLFDCFLQQAALRFDREPREVDRKTQSQLMAHDWPAVFKASGAESVSHSLSEAVEAYEKSLIVEALRRHGGNMTQASAALGTPKTTLFDKVKKYGLQQG